MLSDMQMTEIFDAEIRVPPISNLAALERVLAAVELPSGERQRGMAMLEQAGYRNEGRLNVGVKKLLSVIEMARQADDVADKLTSALLGLS
jgi:vesicle-fusing ATPase